MVPEDSRQPDGLPPDDRWSAVLGPARVHAARAIRRLAEALVLHDVPDETLERVAAVIDAQTAALRAGPDRAARIDALKPTAYTEPPADGAPSRHNPDCIACGPGNASGVGLTVQRDGLTVVGHLVVGPLFRGAPGRAHGGVLALALDDLMGHVLVVHGSPAYTVELTVDYLAASPIGEPIVLRAWLENRTGRRLTIHAEGHAGDLLVVRARGLFITVERLGS